MLGGEETVNVKSGKTGYQRPVVRMRAHACALPAITPGLFSVGTLGACVIPPLFFHVRPQAEKGGAHRSLAVIVLANAV